MIYTDGKGTIANSHSGGKDIPKHARIHHLKEVQVIGNPHERVRYIDEVLWGLETEGAAKFPSIEELISNE